MPVSPPHEPRFGFLDATEPEERREHPLTDIDHGVTQPVERIAEQIASLVTRERRGLPREEEARAQNRLIRLLYGGTTNEHQLRRKIIDRLQQSGNQRSTDVDALLVGATAVVGAIRSERIDFESSRSEHPNIRQFIGMNDALDAKRKVDLVTIRYEPAPSPIIHEVRFIQVKAGAIAPAEQESILEAHREYYGEIEEMEDTERRMIREDATQYVNDTVAHIEADPKRRTAYEDIVLELVTLQLPMDDVHVSHLAEPYNISVAEFQFMLPTTFGRALLKTATDMLTSSTSHHHTLERYRERIMQWVANREPAFSEMKQVLPNWKLDRRYIGATHFLSTTYANGVLIAEQPLNPPDASHKTLTVP